MMLFLLWSNGIVDLKTTFWKNSWLKVAVAIAAIVALRTYSDYKDLSISSFKNIQYH
jgi:hypothetical protein